MWSNRGYVVAAVAALCLAGCADSKPSVESVPVGTEVAVTRQDGGVVEGKLAERDETQVKVVTKSKATKVVPKAEIAEVAVVTPDKPVELPPVAKFREYTVAEGAALALAMSTAIDTSKNQVNDPVEAKLTEAVMATEDGVEALPAGSVVKGRIAAVQAAGKVKGRASIAIEFSSVVVRGESYAIDARWEATAPDEKKKDIAKIGAPAIGGAIVGGILGGKKGAAAGAVIGGGAGAAVVLSKAGEEITLTPGAAMSVKLTRALEVRVPIK